MFEDIDLMQDQEELLVALVEAARGVPREQRENFLHISTNGPDLLFHDGFPTARQMPVITQDLDILARAGLLDLSYNKSANREYWIVPRGYRYYEYLKTRGAEPVEQVEQEINRLIESQDFEQRYPAAHARWLAAAHSLWHADSEADATTIGHRCREAIQAFATALVERFHPDGVPADVSKDVARVRGVLDSVKADLGETEHGLLDALLGYWGAVTDLVQRQEHGAQREGEQLGWEDSRRLIFQAAVLMYEFDRSLRRFPIGQ